MFVCLLCCVGLNYLFLDIYLDSTQGCLSFIHMTQPAATLGIVYVTPVSCPVLTYHTDAVHVMVKLLCCDLRAA